MDPKFFYVFTTLIDAIIAVTVTLRALYIIISQQSPESEPSTALIIMASPLVDILVCSIWLLLGLALFFRFLSEQTFITFSHKVYFLVKFVFFIGLGVYYLYKAFRAEGVVWYVIGAMPVLVIMFVWNKMLLDMFRKPENSDKNVNDAEMVAGVDEPVVKLSLPLNTAIETRESDNNIEAGINNNMDTGNLVFDNKEDEKKEVDYNNRVEMEEPRKSLNMNRTMLTGSNISEVDSRFLDAIYEHNMGQQDLNKY